MGFTPLEHEWIQNVIHMMSSILDIKLNVTYTTNLDHFNKYYEDEIEGTKTSKNDMGSAETMYGYIWLNAEEHKKRPVSELLNTIIHELIHIKYPEMSEENVVLETDKYVPTQKDQE